MVAEAQSDLRRALLAQVNNHVVYQHGGVHGFSAAVGERLAVARDAHGLRDDFAQLAIASHVEDVVGARVLNVAPEEGDFVAQFNHAAFPGVGLHLPRSLDVVERHRVIARMDALLVDFSAVADKPVAHGVGQVERTLRAVGGLQGFDVVRKKEAVALVPEFFGGVCARFLPHECVQAVLAVVSERCVSDVVPDGDGFGQLLVQPEVFCNRGGDRGDVQHVFHARAHVVIVRGEKDLRLVLEPTVCLAVQQPRVVALKRRADVVAAPVDVRLAANRLLPFAAERVAAHRCKSLSHRNSIAGARPKRKLA